MPESKVLWLDSETSGVDYKKHAVIQFSPLIEINNEVVYEGNFFMKPFPQDVIEQEALDRNGRTKDEIVCFPDPQITLMEFRKILGKYVDKYNKQDKFVLAGYNVGFDMDMMRASFEKAGDNYFGSWFFWPVLDVRVMVAQQILEIGLRLENYKLETVCKYFNIQIDAHDSLSDIKATRELYYFLKS